MTLRSVAARVLLQVVTRGATFGLNVAIVRTVSREAVGHAFQLEVLLQMLMFVPREALRRDRGRRARHTALCHATLYVTLS